MRMPVLPLAAALVLSGFSAWEALRDTQLLQLLSVTTATTRSSLVALAKIPTLLETVSIRAGKTFLDPPTTNTEFYLAVIDACFEPAVRSFDEHVAYVEITARKRKFAAAVAAAAAAGVASSEDSAANSTRTAAASHESTALYALVEALYKPSTQVLRLRIQTQGFRRITAIHLHGSSRAPENGRRTVLHNEVGDAGLQMLARLRPRAVISAGQSPVDEQVNQGESKKEDGRQSASRSPATDAPPAVEIMHAIPSASEKDRANGDQNSAGDAESSPINENNASSSFDPPWNRHLIDCPTVRDAFWREVKLTDVEVMDLFRGRLYVDIHTTNRQHAAAQGFLACAQAGRRCRPPQAIAGSGAAEELELSPAAFRPVSCDPDNRLPSWLRKYSRNRLR